MRAIYPQGPSLEVTEDASLSLCLVFHLLEDTSLWRNLLALCQDKIALCLSKLDIRVPFNALKHHLIKSHFKIYEMTN